MYEISAERSQIEKRLKEHDGDGGNSINKSLTKLFEHMPDNSNAFDVEVKVAALNKIYSTSIYNLKPVIKSIVTASKEINNLCDSNYITIIDKIANVHWIDRKNKTQKRNYLSFASKFIHFQFDRKIPIYDSYVWLLAVAFLKLKGIKISFSTPKSYKDFIAIFNKFKVLYGLEGYSNYEVDKFLWQLGKNTFTKIADQNETNLSKAKSMFKKHYNALNI